LMKLSRRSLGKNCVAMLAASMVPQELWGALGGRSALFSSAQSTGSSGPLKIVVDDFSKVFDPAYLSNGLIGIRPGPNPLARAQTCVSGFVFAHSAYRVESLSSAPYPLETDMRVKEISLLRRPLVNWSLLRATARDSTSKCCSFHPDRFHPCCVRRFVSHPRWMRKSILSYR
jgi:hypothetical protein